MREGIAADRGYNEESRDPSSAPTEQLKPESSLTHIEVFDKPLPKTEWLILTVDLEVFGGDGELEVEIPIDSVVGVEGAGND